jgi:hypothetical protein
VKIAWTFCKKRSTIDCRSTGPVQIPSLTSDFTF